MLQTQDAEEQWKPYKRIIHGPFRSARGEINHGCYRRRQFREDRLHLIYKNLENKLAIKGGICLRKAICH